MSLREKDFGIDKYSKFTGTGTADDPLVRVISLDDGLVIPRYDYMSIDRSGGTTNVYTFRSGGLTGDIVATITLTYSDSTKETLLTMAKT